MKTIERLAAEFIECYPAIGPTNATLLGCLYDAWQGGREEALLDCPPEELITERDEIEAGIEFNS